VTILPVAPPPLFRGSVVITDRRGDLRIMRSPSMHPPACIVRRGDVPAFPTPFIEYASGTDEQLALELRNLLPRAQ